MDATEDKVYDGYVLEARILEWSYLMEGMATIIEDKNGDVERLAVYNWSSLKEDFRKKFDEAIKTFRPNSIISIINPYMRMAKDMRSLIRVQSPEYIRLDYTSEDKKCFICGKEAKILPCSACLMARYCSKECQKFDWINFNHKEVCKHLKKFSNLVQK
uniref:MYND-type domain-containing protein n=1 Tax=Panagrolaimus davidi TaxID=227884 RepID=A0A914Q661_9BILA